MKEKITGPARYFVPDLSPRDHGTPEMPRAVFVAESPHISEVTPAKRIDRRPLCGMAGKAWWSLLSEILEGQANPDVSLERELEVCRKHRIAVMNAVQYPLDPKVTASFPDFDPAKQLGFNKVAGEFGYKKQKK